MRRSLVLVRIGDEKDGVAFGELASGPERSGALVMARG